MSLVIVAITVVPAVIMLVVAYLGTGKIQSAATWASLPAIAGMAAAAAGGRRFAVIVAIVMGLLAPLTIVAGTSPVSGAALMALLCITVGRLSRFGLHKSALLAPVMLAWPLITPPLWAGQVTVDREDTAYLLWMALIFLVGGVGAALAVSWLMRKKPKPQLETHSRAESMPYTVMITVLVAVSTYYVLANPRMYGGAFLIAAILVLAPIGNAQALMPTIVRILGTLAGSIFVLGVMTQVGSLVVVYLLGVVFIVLALMARFGSRTWAYYVFMMPATACLNATSLTQVGQLGEQRVVDNLVGGALVLCATAVAIGYSNWMGRHGHVDVDREVAAVSA